jgi:2-desacetyl-2-hydroxyethyl bacteriochlorophyllide A dehydrogenase
MDTYTKARRLIFPEKQKVILEALDLRVPGKGEVLVRMRCSLMSTGTENIVFNRLFAPGTHWDDWVKYPFRPGYASVGVVEQAGGDVQTLKVGDRVATREAHSSHAIVPEAQCFPIPDAVPDEEAVWFALAKIAFLGAKAADYRLGDSCLIIGAGPVGQMALRWASAAGVGSLIVVDTAANRMPLAEAGGATATIIEPIDRARDPVIKAGGGALPRVVIDSTGNAAVFAAALGLAADRGRVLVLGDTGHPGRQVLTPDVIRRGITIVGAHDSHNTPQWNNATITQLLYSLAARGRFSLKGLTSHRFKPEQCMEAYETANRDRSETMGIVFDWTTEGVE